MVQAYVAIGSNLDPAERMLQAARALKQRFPRSRFSRCYRNPAFGFEGQDFVNAVAGFTTTLPVEALLPLLREIEALCGRGARRSEVGAARNGSGPAALRRSGRHRPRLYAAAAGSAAARLHARAAGRPRARVRSTRHRVRRSASSGAQFPQSEHVLTPLELDLNGA